MPGYWGGGNKGKKQQRFISTDTFCVIWIKGIPCDRCKEISHVCVVCKAQPQKEESNCMCINIYGSCIVSPRDVSMPRASLDLVKLMINSMLSLSRANSP